MSTLTIYPTERELVRAGYSPSHARTFAEIVGTSSRKPAPAPAPAPVKAPPPEPATNAEIRAWCAAQDPPVPCRDRGRIPAATRALYDEAH